MYMRIQDYIRSNPETSKYSHVISKLQLACTHTFGHSQIKLSTSVCTDVPSDAYTLQPSLMEYWQPSLSCQPWEIFSCTSLLPSLSFVYFLFIFAFLLLRRSWHPKWFCLFQESSWQIQRPAAKGISQGCSTWPMTCQRLTCGYLTLGTLKAHFRQHWTQLSCSQSAKCSACWIHRMIGAWGYRQSGAGLFSLRLFLSEW